MNKHRRDGVAVELSPPEGFFVFGEVTDFHRITVFGNNQPPSVGYPLESSVLFPTEALTAEERPFGIKLLPTYPQFHAFHRPIAKKFEKPLDYSS